MPWIVPPIQAESPVFTTGYPEKRCVRVKQHCYDVLVREGIIVQVHIFFLGEVVGYKHYRQTYLVTYYSMGSATYITTATKHTFGFVASHHVALISEALPSLRTTRLVSGTP